MSLADHLFQLRGYIKRVAWDLTNEDQEDLINELWLRMHDQQAASEDELIAFIKQCARWLAHDKRRKQRRSRDNSLSAEPLDQCESTNPVKEAERRELKAKLNETIEQLAEDERALVLGKWAGEKSSSIARELGKSEASIRQHWQRLKPRLQKRLRSSAPN